MHLITDGKFNGKHYDNPPMHYAAIFHSSKNGGSPCGQVGNVAIFQHS